MNTTFKNPSIPMLALLLCFAVTPGCTPVRQQTVARLEQENAEQRERIWRSNMKMEDFRRENESLRRQLAALESRGQGTAGSGVRSARRSVVNAGTLLTGGAVPAEAGTPGRTLPSGASERSISTPPAVELGSPSDGTPAWMNGQNISHSGVVRVRKTDSDQVYSVQILPQKTRAIHYQGLHAEVQLRDATGQIVLAPGPMVVRVTDPSLPDDRAKVCKWTYTAEQLAEIINAGEAALTIPLDMEWARFPENLDLELHVLYKTGDNRLLMHNAPFRLGEGAYGTVAAGSGTSAGLTLEVAEPSPAVGADAESGGVRLARPVWSPNP